MDKDGNTLSPGQISYRIQNDQPRSVIHTSSSSSPTSSSADSCIYVQTNEDDHHSPKTLTPKRGKPAMNGIIVSKSDTDTNRASRQSMKFHNESFGPAPSRRDSDKSRRDSDKTKSRPGVVKRTSRFSERLHATSKTSKTGTDSREIGSKPRLSIQADIEREPMPSIKVDDNSPGSKSGFFKKRPALVLTPGQLDMINDKVAKKTGLQRQRSLSVNLEKPKQGRSKLLQRISNIAARESVMGGLPGAEPAVIFKQLLKKVNPESLHKAEKDLKRRYFRKIFQFLKACVKVPFEILTPEDFFTIFWTFFILFTTIYDSFLKPFEVCFYTFDRDNGVMQTSNIITTIIFGFDIMFNFRTAFYNKGVLVDDSRAVAKHYWENNFKWDITVIIIDIITLAVLENGIWHLKLLSILRFKKLMDLMVRTEDFLNLSRIKYAGLKLFKLWGTIILLAHWIACIFYLIAVLQPVEVTTWVDKKYMDNASISETYVAAIYWSILTMTTVGYGDIAPVSVAERVYAVLAMILASAVFGYSMNTVATVIKEISYEKDQRKEKISNVKHYMNQKNLGKNIQTRVKNYIQYIIDSRALYRPDEEQFMDLLSQTLKDEIVSEVNGKILAGSKMFSVNFSRKAALNLAKFMKETFFAPEEVIFEEGDRTDCSIYFIAYGKIQLYHRVKELNVLEKGMQFGEIAFFSGQGRTTGAKSLFFSNLYSLARDIALENLNAVPSDFEMFHFIKDRININQDYTQIEILCFACQRRGHLARDCDKIHFVPDRAEVIKAHIERLKGLQKKFQRNNTRSKFRALSNMGHLEQVAQMVQEDYSDFTLSDEELSQDSLDVILEKNLIILPGQEANDLKVRKTERRNKSQRYSVQIFMGEIAGGTSPITVAQRFSHLSQITKDETEARASMKLTPTEIVYFTIDKVENFEVYYPQFNIRTMIQKFEKDRVQQMLKGNKGGARALVLKGFGSLLRDKNRRGTIMPPASPVYFARSSYEKKPTLHRGRKTLKNDQNVVDSSGLKTQMHKAIVRAKTLRKTIHKKGTSKAFEEDGFGSNNYSTPADSVDKTPFDMINESLKRKFSSDEGTMSRKETYDDKKTLKQKQRVFNFETLSPHTMGQLKLDRSDTHSHSQVMPSSTRMLGAPESPATIPNFPRKSKTKDSSKKGTIIQHLLTRQSLDEKITLADFAGVKCEEIEHALLHALIKEEYSLGERASSKKAKRGRAYSLERLDDMKKAISKFKMPKILKGLMEGGTTPVNTAMNAKTANFGI